MARRNPIDAGALDPALTQKKRARRRLVGAVVLGVAVAIILPLMLDSEPRQTITDVEIEIPPREAALPPVDTPKQGERAIVPRSVESVDETPVPAPPPAPVADVEPEAKAEPIASKKPANGVPVKEKPAQASSGAAPSPAVATVSSAPFALQIGAFANAGSARAQLDKARRTGLRAYTESVQTTQGARTRVRVGPFPSREEAEKARATLKLAGIDSVVVDAR